MIYLRGSQGVLAIQSGVCILIRHTREEAGDAVESTQNSALIRQHRGSHDHHIISDDTIRHQRFNDQNHKRVNYQAAATSFIMIRTGTYSPDLVSFSSGTGTFALDTALNRPLTLLAATVNAWIAASGASLPPL